VFSSACRKALRHRDRWQVADMLQEQPDLRRQDSGRDMDLWRHLFAPDDIVRVGDSWHPAREAVPAEWCWGNTWADAVIRTTVALCLPASGLLRGSTREEVLNQQEACEAVIGRLRCAGAEIVLIVDDSDNGLECWIEPALGTYWTASSHSRGRCPGGVNTRTGRPHRVVWAHPFTRIAWDEDDW
jgi:hypothetical protein